MNKSSKISPDDFKHLFAADCEQMEARYEGASIYKYFHFPNSELLAEFLSKPTIKFAHKSDLEDPFELTKRWEEFGCPFNREIFEQFVRRPLRGKLSDIVRMRKALASKAKEKMPGLARRERRRIVSFKFGIRELAAAREGALTHASSFEFLMPITFPTMEREFIDDFAKTTGILSLTANPASRYMWNKYAGGGRGFVLEYNARHDFFMHRGNDGLMRKLIRPVFYRNDRISDFWKNPHYLFLVKHERWIDEQEWRVIKALNECRRVERADGIVLYLVDAQPNLIASIILGYNNSSKFIEDAVSRLSRFDGAIKFRRAAIGCGSESQIQDL